MLGTELQLKAEDAMANKTYQAFNLVGKTDFTQIVVKYYLSHLLSPTWLS